MHYYSVYDLKSGLFCALSPAPSDDVLKRNLITAILSADKSQYLDFPEDFQLWHILEFEERDPKGGVLVDAHPICSMIDIVKECRRLLGRDNPITFGSLADTAVGGINEVGIRVGDCNV